MGFPWQPTKFDFTVASKWPKPPLVANRANPVDAVVKITHADHRVPAGTVIVVTASTPGQPDINVALQPLPRDVTYVSENPIKGNVVVRWTFRPVVPGKYTFTYRDMAGIVRGIDYPTVRAAL